MKKTFSIIKNCFIMTVLLLVATIIGHLFREIGFQEPNIVVIYILAVMLVAKFSTGYVYGIVSSVISILVFNYLFTAPYKTFDVYDPSYFSTFTIMAITSLITSTMTSKEIMLTKRAEEKEREARELYSLTNLLSDADTIDKVIVIGVNHISELLRYDVGFVYFEREDKYNFTQKIGSSYIHRRIEQIHNLIEELTDLRSEYLEEKETINYPIYGNERVLGCVRIDKAAMKEITSGKNRLLHSMIENIAIALDRIVVTNARILDQEAVVRERYRANLLRAISHDLRTPLSGIMGTSEMLLDMTESKDRRYELIKGIYKEADWLHSLVENILSLTRLQDGKMVVRKEKEAIEEVIACAVSHIEKSYPGREVQVVLPDQFMLVPMDAHLIEQVITNLLDNAVKHTKPAQKIEVSVSYDEKVASVTIKDEGEGIAGKDVANIFQMFYTTGTKSADAKRGIGLGLAICETVIKAHGGVITGNNRTDKRGAEFTFTLPLEEGETVV